MPTEIKSEVVVLGGGPGGYSAAFRAADLGKQVVLIEQYDRIGGVCLNVGCIPSKIYLHAVKVIADAKDMSDKGIQFAEPQVDAEKLAAWKENVVSRLTGGLKMLAKQRKVEIVQGYGKFISDHKIEVTNNDEKTIVSFEQAIIAAGSKPQQLPFLPKNDPRIMNSTDALELKNINQHLLIIGAGVIGVEMASIYQGLGAKITLVDICDQMLPMMDKDIVTPLERRLKRMCEKIYLSCSVEKVEAKEDGIYVQFSSDKAPTDPQRFDAVLCATGRTPSGKLIDAEKAVINVDEKGFIAVDKQLRTNVSNIYAIGDIIGNPMLAHKAEAEGRAAAEIIAGKLNEFVADCIPSVVYTDPEIASVGLTEAETKDKNIPYRLGTFPWMANGRSLTMNSRDGITKLIFHAETHQLLGASIVGPQAGELIAEAALAIRKQCAASDIASTIHPHPTLSETIMMAAEVFEGTVTDILL